MSETKVPYTQFADGVDGELITWDSSGFPATVAAGTAGQGLLSNGPGTQPSFQTIPSISSGITGFLPKFTSATALGLSKAFETTNTFSIGTNTGIDSFTRLYVYGGNQGANIDVRGISGAATDQAVCELQAADYSTSFRSMWTKYSGVTATGTTDGITNADRAELAFQDPANAVIRSITDIPIQVFINGGQMARFTSSSLDVRTGKDLRIFDSDNTQYVAIKAPPTGSLTTSYTLTLPVDDGTSGQYLQTDGSGVLSWQTVSGGGSSSGIAGAVQISGGAGAFSSDATNFFFNTTSKQLNIAGNTSYGVTIGGTGNGYDASPAGAVTGAFAALRSNVDATGNVNLSINNLNTTGSANARISATTSAGGGDPFLQLSTAEVGYIIGVDNDGSDKLFMGLGSNPSSMTTTNITLSGVAMGVMQTSPTAKLHLGAGTTGATTAPLKFTSGVNMTTPEAGAVEWDGTNLFITQTTGPTRKTIAYTDSAMTGNVNLSQLVSGTFSNNGSGGLTGTLALNDFLEFTYNGGGTALIVNDLLSSTVMYSKDATQFVETNNSLVRIASGTSRMDYIDGVLRLYDSDATQYIGFQTPVTGSLTTSYTLTFPTNDGTAGNQALVTDGSGTLSWSTNPVGDVIGVASSVDSEIALFNGVGGKTIKRATGTGVAIVTSGVLSTKTNPTGAFVGESDTQTLSAKRIDPRVTSTTSSSTPTPNVANEDIYILTALAANATFGSPAGTPVQGTKLLIRVKDNATPRTLAWNAIYRAIGVTLPTTTTANKTLYVGCSYNSTDTKWDVIAVTQEV